MSKIKVMDELLSNKIAAGEVVERCSSVVKELVENSIDAGSTEIKIELVEAGTKEIKVIDNGIGMDREDAVLCFDRHATSKLKSEEDLFRITTLGFRGEALPSIASVSKIELQTCSNNVGTLVKIEGGKIVSVENSISRKGTIIKVSDLFYNTPARLKHMKSLYTELASITEYVNKIALSNPNIRFVLENNGQVLLNTDASDNLLKTIKNIYGIDIAKKMVYIKGNTDDYEVEGYMSLPEIHRSSRNNMITIVNKRVVRNTELNRIINDSYHSYKPDNRYPIVVLDIKTDPSLIDVNIHPTKMDIKFSKFNELCELIERLIKEKLNVKVLIPKIEVEKPKYEELKIDFDSLDIKKEIEIKNTYDEIKKEINEPENMFINEKEEYVVNEDLVIKDDIKEESETKEEMPLFYRVGIVHGTYIICQNEDGMFIIDQHAAKERVNYEYYLKKLGEVTNNKTSMLIPLTLEFSNNEFIILKERLDFIRSLNFDIEEFGINSVIIKAHPTWLLQGYENDQIRKILEVIMDKNTDFSVEKFNEKISTMLSCKMAIKANDYISDDECDKLIEDLRKCKNPYNCPHGRPTIIYYSKLDLEKLFKRTGFDKIN